MWGGDRKWLFREKRAFFQPNLSGGRSRELARAHNLIFECGVNFRRPMDTKVE